SQGFTARKTPDKLKFRYVRCRGCGLIYANPVLPPESLSALYNVGGFIQEPQLENMLSDYLAQIGRATTGLACKRVLEVGCANGELLLRAREAFGLDEVWGVEPCAEAYEAADMRIKPHILADIFREGLFPPGHFDLVMFFQVFDHIPAPNEFLNLVAHYLRPGGRLLALHHNIRAPMPVLLGRHAPTFNIQHVFLWDKHTMRRILENHGFTVEGIHGCWNSYYVDHVLRMLPVPRIVKNTLRKALGGLGLGNLRLRAYVENMVTLATKPA
ncbi:MAG: class I SAM-dependent methyltransferase, partial [Humidesulfovibrio sp.]|nr:class I SAM-dependent methyltransferase [Humidesulfovibrio sp.]